MTLGKTIRLFLIDGTPRGPVLAEVMNWTGSVLVVPRAKLAELANREEVSRTGIYFLVGANPDRAGQDRVYIGEADEVFRRLIKHDKDESKDFWTRAVVITSKDSNLTKAHVRFLESRLLELVKDAGRVSVANGNAPGEKNLPEPDVADMEHFLIQVQLILPSIGMTFLQPKPEKVRQEKASVDTVTFLLTDAGAYAEAIEVEDEFVVLEGATARKQGVPSWTSYPGLRDQLVDEGKLVDGNDDEYFVFTEDVAFSSPSAAASVIAARNMNGRKRWKVKGQGMSYGEWKDKAIEAAKPL